MARVIFAQHTYYIAQADQTQIVHAYGIFLRTYFKQLGSDPVRSLGEQILHVLVVDRFQ